MLCANKNRGKILSNWCAVFSILFWSMCRLQFFSMNCLIYLCIFHLFINWTCGEAIQGESVRDAAQNEFPYVVAISDVSDEINCMSLSSNSRLFCTGSLITKKHVLTAEHCLLTKQVHEVEVLVGSTNLDQCKAYDPEEWITWQEWEYGDPEQFPNFYHDVAVITLKKCVTENNIIPVVLSKKKPRKLFGTNVKLAGWGLTDDADKPKILKTVDLKVLSNVDCHWELSQMVEKNFTLLDWHLCATSEPWALNACGDSGGPLIDGKKKIIGVTIGTCPSVQTLLDRQVVNRFLHDRVNIYTNLYYYRDFVEHFTNGNNDCRLLK